MTCFQKMLNPFPSQTPEEKEEDCQFMERSGNVLQFDYLFAVKQDEFFYLLIFPSSMPPVFKLP